MITLQDLITRAKEVRDERQTARNTATRVGQLLHDIILFFNDLISGFTEKINEVSRLNDLKQDKHDNNLETSDKTVVGAINDLNGRVNSVVANLEEGWNTVLLNRLYPVSWVFLGKPFCFTQAGFPVDFKIRNYANQIVGSSHAFDIYVDTPCRLHASTTPYGYITAEADHLILCYYYEGQDGIDLDTVTDISTPNWPLSSHTLGYGHIGNGTHSDTGLHAINDGNDLIAVFGGDNTSGGDGTTRYYESVYFNVKKMRELLPNQNIEITLYGTWWSQRLRGQIHIDVATYVGDNPVISVANKTILLSGVEKTFETQSETDCNVTATTHDTAGYKTAYTPCYRVILTQNNEIKIVQLS